MYRLFPSNCQMHGKAPGFGKSEFQGCFLDSLYQINGCTASVTMALLENLEF